MSKPTGNDGCDPTEPVNSEEKDVLSDDSDDEIASGIEKGSDTCPKAKSNEPKAAVTLPFRPCNICFKDHLHYNPRCPYRDIVPRGATVGPGYQVMCQGCGSEFIIAKWVCSFCGGKGAKVSAKGCLICNAHSQHTSEECPVDPVAAAEYKRNRERRLRSYRQVGALVPAVILIPRQSPMNQSLQRQCPCDICSMDHPGSRCSYWEYVPQGSTVGPGYQVLCQGCCSDFIIEKWVCSFCGAKQGKVFLKYCSVCHTHGQHNTDECPEDEATAATHKFLRERRRQVKVLVPVKPSYVPPPPLPGSVPVKPSYVLPHVPGYVATSPF